MARATSCTRLPLSFCLNRFPLRIWARPKPPRIDSKAVSAGSVEKNSGNDEEKKQAAGAVGRRIMVVVDSSREAEASLQWALSHTVQSLDTIVLVDVIKSSSLKINGDHHGSPKSYALLYAMKKFCQARRPEVEVEVEVSLVEGKDQRGPAIVAEAKRQGASLLVLGQRRRSMTLRLLRMWAGRRSRGGGVVEYCIQNASCITLAVRRKSRRGGGGYLITSRRQKNFWLLA